MYHEFSQLRSLVFQRSNAIIQCNINGSRGKMIKSPTDLG